MVSPEHKTVSPIGSIIGVGLIVNEKVSDVPVHPNKKGEIVISTTIIISTRTYNYEHNIS